MAQLQPSCYQASFVANLPCVGLSQILIDPRFNAEDFWLPTYELRYLPYLEIYPEFPTERWEDLVKYHLPSRESIMKIILNSPQQP